MPPPRPFGLGPAPAALALAFCAAGAAANPQGGVVQAGAATITSNGSRVDILQSSQRAVIDWRSFSIGTGGHVNFRHPSAAGATLNRVTGPEASAILGRLTANGTVFLVNPNGILIGPGAKIDVGGLVAATANLSNENFMAGRYKFDEVVNRNAVIVNRGEITAHAGGLVALVAPGVENSGVIRAELGRVVLASGNRFTLDPFGDKLIAFAIDDKVAARLTDVDGRPLTAYVNQAGTIEAGGGSILIAASAAKAVLDNVINTSGVVRATSFAQRGGEIVLAGGDEGVVRVAGTLDASGRAGGASGGSVRVLGAEVVLDAGSRIDVAGDAGGGSAFVGGGVQGGGDLPRSSRTAIEAGATVNADALTSGNGGTIVAWSDGETRFAGALSARGGASGGDGGFVEVSGKRELAFAGAVDLAAPAGRGGRLLLDPEFLTVDAATATAVGSALRSGARAQLTATDTIDVQHRIDGRGGASDGALTLSADNRIEVNNDILTNGAPITLRAGPGGIVMNAGPSDSVTGGNGAVIHTGDAGITLVAAGDVTAQHLVTAGAVQIESTAGAARLTRDLGGPRGEGIGSLRIAAATSAELNGVNAAGTVFVATSRADGAITLAGPVAATANITIGDASLAQATSIRLRSDLYTEQADIVLNGRTWIDPIVQPEAANVGYSNLFRLAGPPRYYENPLVQVAVRTSGAGAVRFNGDVLWGGGDEARLPQVPYVYNVLKPPPFDSRSPAQVAALRSEQLPQSTGYFGLNVAVGTGNVEFLGNLGMFTAAGVEHYVAAPRGTLTRTIVQTPSGPTAAVPTVLNVEVSSSTFSRDAGTAEIAFAPESKVTVGRFRIVNPTSRTPDYDSIDVAGVSTVFRGAAREIKVPLAGNMPNVSVSSGGPNLIGPSPRNVARPAAFADAGPLPEIPLANLARTAPAAALTPDGSVVRGTLVDGGRTTAAGEVSREAGGIIRATHLEGPRGIELRDRSAPGAAPDVFWTAAPLTPFAGERTPGADPDYFSQGPFDFLESRAQHAAESR
jgi:filamentous hemagglutinin family protein